MSKIVIRKGVFETNSSSVHAISINRDAKRHIPEEVRFSLGQFGWECETYGSWEKKAAYLWTAIKYLDRDREAQQKAEQIAEVLKAAGVQSVIFEGGSTGNSDYDYFYVDHAYDLMGFISDVLDNSDLLLDFLFGSESEVITGNDNDEDERPQITPKQGNTYTYWKGN